MQRMSIETRMVVFAGTVVFVATILAVFVIYPKVDDAIKLSAGEFWQTIFQMIFIPITIAIASGAFALSAQANREAAQANENSSRVASAQTRPWVGLCDTGVWTPAGGIFIQYAATPGPPVQVDGIVEYLDV